MKGNGTSGTAIDRRTYLKLTAPTVTVGGVVGCLGSAGGYPSRTIEWINPSGGGGGYGAYAQALSKYAPEQLPNDVEIPVTSVGNWPRGTSRIYRAEPDGYTIGWVDVPGVIGYQLVQNPEFDLREFSILNRAAFHPFSIAVPADSPFESIEDLQKQDEVTFAAPGGAVVTILSAIAAEIMDIPIKLVTGYSGSPGIINAVLRGDAQAVSLPPTTPPMATALQNGELRVLVTYRTEPPELAPNAPTAAELGYDELTGKGITRLVGGPPGIADDRAATLSEAFLETMKSSDGFRGWAKENDLFRPLAPLGRDGARTQLEANFDLMSEYESVLENNI